jgi:alpha-tubulin suppressor-like RCC1 family protein
MKRLVWFALVATLVSALAAHAALPQPTAVLAAGANASGQLGTGDTTSSSTPVPSSGLKAIGVAGGIDFSVALLKDQTVKGWGANYQAQLGPRTGQRCGFVTECVPTPTTISGFDHIRQVDAGSAVTVGLRNNGTVWSLGWNMFGQLGNGKTQESATPVKASGLTQVVGVAAGGNHTVALKADGTVWTWGWNIDGQLGRPTTTICQGDQPCGVVPRKVPGLGKAVAVAAGYSFSLAVLADGTLWGWGINNVGQLGTTTDTCEESQLPCAKTPKRIDGIDGVAAVTTGDAHVLALRSDGSVWAWGYDFYGQVGDGATNSVEPAPKQVAGLPPIRSISGGQVYSLAIDLTGALYAWGKNSSGQFGNGTTVSSASPVLVPGSYLAAAGCNEHTLFIAAS